MTILFNWESPAAVTQYLRTAQSTVANKEMLARQIRFDQAFRAASLAAAYPRLPSGAVAGMAIAGIEADDPVAAEIALQDEEARAAAADAYRAQTGGRSSAVTATAEDGGFLPWDLLKGTSRLVLGSFDALWNEVVTRPIRTMVGMNQGLDYDTAYQRAGASYMTRALDEIAAGRPVNLGSGFLPQSDLSEQTELGLEQGLPYSVAARNPEQAQIGSPLTQIAREAAETGITLTSRGGIQVPVSPGRLLAVTVTEPETVPFNILSGMTDLAANIFLDPANALGAGYTKLRRASNFLIQDGMRPAIFQRSWQQYLDDVDGRFITDWLANETDYRKIYGLLMGRKNGNADFALALKDAATPAAVREVLWDMGSRGRLRQTLTPISLTQRARIKMGGGFNLPLRPISGAVQTGMAALPRRVAGGVAGFGPTREMTRLAGFGVGVKYGLADTWVGRMASQIGYRAIPVHDIDQGVHDIGEWLTSAGFGGDRISYYMERYARGGAGNYENAWRIITREIMPEWGRMLQEAGLPQPAIDSVMRLFTDSETYRKYWLDAVGRAAYHPAVKTKMIHETGQFINSPSAMLISEFLEQAIPVVDPREVRKALRAASINRFRDALGMSPSQRISGWDDFGESVITQMADSFMNKVWKPMVLLRPAWAVRVLGEESVRMFADGLLSPLHPIHYIQTIIRRSYTKNVFGDDFLDLLDHEAALSRSGVSRFLDDMGGFKPPHMRDYDGIAPTDPRYPLAKALEGVKLARDPVAQQVLAEVMQAAAAAGGRVDTIPTLEATKRWFSTGEGQQFLRRLLADGGNWERLRMRSMQDRYIETVWARAQAFAGGKVAYQDHRDMIWRYMDGRPIPLDELPEDIATRIGYATGSTVNVPASLDNTSARLYSRLVNIYDEIHLTGNYNDPRVRQAVGELLDELNISPADWHGRSQPTLPLEGQVWDQSRDRFDDLTNTRNQLEIVRTRGGDLERARQGAVEAQMNFDQYSRRIEALVDFATRNTENQGLYIHSQRDLDLSLRILLDDVFKDGLPWAAPYVSRDLSVADELYRMIERADEMDLLLSDGVNSISTLNPIKLEGTGLPDNEIVELRSVPNSPLTSVGDAGADELMLELHNLNSISLRVWISGKDQMANWSWSNPTRIAEITNLRQRWLPEMREHFDNLVAAMDQARQLPIYSLYNARFVSTADALGPAFSTDSIAETRRNLDWIEGFLDDLMSRAADADDVAYTVMGARDDYQEATRRLRAVSSWFDDVDPTGMRAKLNRELGRQGRNPYTGMSALAASDFVADAVYVSSRDGHVVGSLQLGDWLIDPSGRAVAPGEGLRIIRGLQVAPGYEDEATALIRRALDDEAITPEGLLHTMLETEQGVIPIEDWLQGVVQGKLRRWPNGLPEVWNDEGAAEAVRLMRDLGLDQLPEWQPLYRVLERGGWGKSVQPAWEGGPVLFHGISNPGQRLEESRRGLTLERGRGSGVMGQALYTATDPETATDFSRLGAYPMTYVVWDSSEAPRILNVMETVDLRNPDHLDVLDNFHGFMTEQIEVAKAAGVDQNIIDPLIIYRNDFGNRMNRTGWAGVTRPDPYAGTTRPLNIEDLFHEVIREVDQVWFDAGLASGMDMADDMLPRFLRDHGNFDGYWRQASDPFPTRGWGEVGWWRPENVKLRSVTDQVAVEDAMGRPVRTIEDLQDTLKRMATGKKSDIPVPADLDTLIDRIVDAASIKAGRDVSRAEALTATWSPTARNPRGQVQAALAALSGDDLDKIPLTSETWRVLEPADPELLKAVAEGRVVVGADDIDLRTLSPKDPGAAGWKERRRQLSEVAGYIEGRAAETGIVGENWMPMPRALEEGQHKTFDDVIRWLFDTLMTKPTNYLSRSPAFRQYYWRRMGELLPFLSRADREVALRMAREAGVKRSSLRSMVRGLVSPGDELDDVVRSLDELVDTANLKGVRSLGDPQNPMSLAEADEIAKVFGIEETRRLLYDTTRKHNFWDMTRHFFPFGEAWWEILSTWNRLIMDNPRYIRRAQQFINGARETDVVQALTDPDAADRRGFFYKDPVSGEEVFNYPGWDLMAKWMFSSDTTGQEYQDFMQSAGSVLPGDQPPLQYPNADADNYTIQPTVTGRVSGVNLLLGSFMPGVGPLVQIPAASMQFLREPRWKAIRELILPFGGDEPGSLGEIADSFVMPAWTRKFLVAAGRPTGEQARLYGNTVIDVLRHRIQTGQAKWNSYEDMQDAMRNAENEARFLWLIRFASQFVGPTGGSVRYDVRDDNGNLWAFQTLSTEYRRMLEDNNFNHDLAFTEFVSRFGLDPSLYYTAKTRSIVRRSVTEPGADWQARNSDLFDKYNLSAYYANPDSIRDPFHYPAYLEQLKQKVGGPDRISLSPQQWWEERNDFLGRIAYERIRRVYTNPQTGRTRSDTTTTTMLRNFRLALANEYPGFDIVTPGLAEPIPRDQIIAEIETWAGEPRLTSTQAGTAAMQYLGARRWAISQATAMGITPTGFATARRTEYLRYWLASIGSQLVQQYPEFGPMWEQVLSRELEQDQQLSYLGVNIGGNE